jgi:hypothetical protein
MDGKGILVPDSIKPWLFHVRTSNTHDEDIKSYNALLQMPDARFDARLYDGDLVDPTSNGSDLPKGIRVQICARLFRLDLSEDLLSIQHLQAWSDACPNLAVLLLGDLDTGHSVKTWKNDEGVKLKAMFPQLRQLTVWNMRPSVACVLLFSWPRLISFLFGGHTRITGRQSAALRRVISKHVNLRHVHTNFDYEPPIQSQLLYYVARQGYKTFNLSRDKASFAAALTTFALAGTRANRGHALCQSFVGSDVLIREMTAMLRPTERRDLIMTKRDYGLAQHVASDERLIDEHGKAVQAKMSKLVYESRYGRAVCGGHDKKRKSLP